MIKGGYILQPRHFDRSEISKSPPVVRELWLYILRRVNHADNSKFKRGQGFFALADIQEDLSWYVGYRKEKYSKPQLTKSLRKLCEGNMIETAKATRGIIVTVLNYDYYQTPSNYESNAEGNTKETRRKRGGHTKNKNVEELKNKDKILSASGDAVGDDGQFVLTPVDEHEPYIITKKGRKLKGKRLEKFNEFWEAFDYKRGKAEAADAWYDLPAMSEAEWNKIIGGAKREAEARPLQDRTPKMAQGWLSGRRWEDEDTYKDNPVESNGKSPLEWKSGSADRYERR